MFDHAIRLITFDLDDTVWPCMPVIEAAEAALHAWLHERAPRLARTHDIASMRRHRRALMEARPEIAHDLGQVRRHSLAVLLASFDYPGNLAEEAVALFDAHRNRVEPFGDVIPTLAALAGRYRLFSLTNGTANPQATPLRGLFERSFTPLDMGAAKPDPRFFLHVLEQAGCDPHEALHLGDDPWMDVAGARSVGLNSVWVNRFGRTWPEALEPPAVSVSDLREILNWLGGERPRGDDTSDIGPAVHSGIRSFATT